MYQAIVNVPNLSLVLQLKQLGVQNCNLRCCFKRNSKELEGTTSGNGISSKRQPLVEKNENSKQPVELEQKKSAGLHKCGMRYKLKTVPQAEVMRLVGDNPQVLGGLINFPTKEEYNVFFIDDAPFGLQLDADKLVQKKSRNILFLCFWCGKSLHKTNTMLAHSYSHIGVKQFPCSSCDKAYSYKAGLTKHYRSHHSPGARAQTPKNDQPKNSLGQHFTCSICQQGYELKNSFFKHWRVHHKNSGRPQPIITRTDGTSPAAIPQIVEEIPALVDTTCSICSKKYSTKKSLQIHFNNIHSTINNFLCPYCFKGFYYKRAYDAHMKKEYKSQRVKNADKENMMPFEPLLQYINN